MPAALESRPSGAPLEPLVGALAARARRGMELGLEPTRRALAQLGDPHLELACVHVAGTNGKGSTCAMIEAAGRAAGIRTGLYTSPHLCRIAERIRVGGEPIHDDALAASLERVLALEIELTFFESLTVAAFDAFREARVALAILEVGLGGRLDATNVVPAPKCTAITSIGLDHQSVLGDTLEAIAGEKAGIAKPGVPLVLGRLPPAARAAALEIARSVGAGPIRIVERAIDPPRGLAGAHQGDNAAVALEVVRVLTDGGLPLATILPAVSWPGRLERIVSPHGDVLLDCAHNLDAARALAAALPSLGHEPQRTVMVFGALADKSFGPMLETLAPLARTRIYTCPKGRAPAHLPDLAAIAPGTIEPDPWRALTLARERAAPGDVVLVTGSSYLVGEIRGKLLGIECDPVIAL